MTFRCYGGIHHNIIRHQGTLYVEDSVVFHQLQAILDYGTFANSRLCRFFVPKRKADSWVVIM